MTAQQRRTQIEQTLNTASGPVSASALATQLGVSRQIVVGDIALLRAGGEEIDATPRGYVLHRAAAGGYVGLLACVHTLDSQMQAELYTVVDNGGVLEDVKIENPLYGELCARLNIASRYEANEFLKRAHEVPDGLLSRLTGGVHLHTLRCPDKETFDRICTSLEQQGLLVEK